VPFLALAGLLVFASCQDAGTASREATVRDSAGVRLVEIGPSGGEGPFIHPSAEPVYRVGWAEGGHVFQDVVAGALRPDGRAVVADGGQAQQVVLLSATGAVDTVLGRLGDGPGEFRFIFSVVPLGDDSILVGDPFSRRLSVLHQGGFARSLSLGGESNLRLLGLGAGPNPRALFGPPLAGVMGRRGERPWLPVPLVSLDPASGQADTLGWADWDQSIAFGGNNPFMSGGFATTSGGGFVVGRGDRPELRWLDGEGRLRQIVRWQAEARPVSDSLRVAWEVAMREAFGESGRLTEADIDARIRTMLDAIREPEPFFGVAGPMPRHGGLLTDLDGNVWIAEYELRRRAAPTRYYGLSPEGDWTGVLELPEGLEVLAIGTDRVLAVERNLLDEHAVAVYRLERR
jgi:hypothetical protein